MPKRSADVRAHAEKAEKAREAVAKARRTQAAAATGTSSLGDDPQEEEEETALSATSSQPTTSNVLAAHVVRPQPAQTPPSITAAVRSLFGCTLEMRSPSPPRFITIDSPIAAHSSSSKESRAFSVPLAEQIDDDGNNVIIDKERDDDNEGYCHHGSSHELATEKRSLVQTGQLLEEDDEELAALQRPVQPLSHVFDNIYNDPQYANDEDLLLQTNQGQRLPYGRLPDEAVRELMHFDGGQAWLNDVTVYNALMRLAEADERVVVVDPLVAAINPAMTNDVLATAATRAHRFTHPRERIITNDRWQIAFVPVNLANNHWTLAVMTRSPNLIRYYDTMHGGGHGQVYGMLITIWNSLIAQTTQPNRAVDFQVADRATITDQRALGDGQNCGVYVCLIAEGILQQRATLRFTVEDAKAWRRNTYRLVTGNDMPARIARRALSPPALNTVIRSSHLSDDDRNRRRLDFLAAPSTDEQQSVSLRQPPADMEDDRITGFAPYEPIVQVPILQMQDGFDAELAEIDRELGEDGSSSSSFDETRVESANFASSSTAILPATLARYEGIPIAEVAKRDRKRVAEARKRQAETPEQHADRVRQKREVRYRRRGITAERLAQLDALRAALVAANERQRRKGETHEQYLQRLNDAFDRVIVARKDLQPDLAYAARNASNTAALPTTDTPFDRVCPHCNAELTAEDPQSICCMNGRVELQTMPQPPDELRNLYDGVDADSIEFRENLRAYNNALAMGVLVCNEIVMPDTRNCMKVIGRVQGQICELNAAQQGEPKMGHLYFYSTAEAVERRQQHIRDRFGIRLRRPLLERLERCLRTHMPHARQYEHAYQRQRMEDAKAAREGRPSIAVSIGFRQRSGDPKRNVARSVVREEVAMIYVPDKNGRIKHPGYSLLKANGDAQPLRAIDPNADPVVYPLLHPFGTLGWSPGIPKRKSRKRSHSDESAWVIGFERRSGAVAERDNVSMREFYAYRLCSRKGEENYILHSNDAFQQYATDAQAKIEGSAFNFHRGNQGSYKRMRLDDIVVDDDIPMPDLPANAQLGMSVVLPSSHAGSPRNLYAKYLNALAVIEHIGAPDLFITFTCSPEWADITGNIRRSKRQTAFNRMDRTTRVFNAKLKLCMRWLVKKHVLGHVKGYAYAVEFDNRGLPHAHILLIMHDVDKPRTPAEIDDVISAEMPDPVEDRELFDLVMKYHVHGPCGLHAGSYTACEYDASKGRCSKGFPKPFVAETYISDHDNPMYRRSMDCAHEATLNRYGRVDNRYVIPYNAKLLRAFRSHINVEIVASRLFAVKYLYKYIYRGDDCGYFTFVTQALRHAEQRRTASQQPSPPPPQTSSSQALLAASAITDPLLSSSVVLRSQSSHASSPATDNDNDRVPLNLELDEITWVEDRRYICSSEACWRIWAYPMSGLSHHVETLPLHLEGQNVVFISGERDVREQIRAKKTQLTKLTAFFELNKSNRFAQTLLYANVPMWFSWNAQTRQWNERKNNNCDFNTVSRLANVSSRHVELFHLRILLAHVRGPTSFNSLRTVNKQTHFSYVDACRARGLIADDDEWRRCLSEAAVYMMPSQMRSLFVAMLTHCAITNAEQLWQQFMDELSYDQRHFANRYARAMRKIQYALMCVDRILESVGLRPLDDLRTVRDEDALEELADNNDDDDAAAEALIAVSSPRTAASQNTEQQQASHIPRFQRGNERVAIARERHQTEADNRRRKFTHEQRRIFDAVMLALRTPIRKAPNLRRLFYVQGEGGSGKSFVHNAMIHAALADGYNAVIAAPTGIAATLLYGGRTAHNAFGLPRRFNETSTSLIRRGTEQARRLSEAHLIVCDEVSMMHKETLRIMHLALQDLTGNREHSFGGKVIVLGGDFKQLLPIVPPTARATPIEHSLLSSPYWELFQAMRLSINQRTGPGQEMYANWLFELGIGRLNDANDDVILPPACVVKTELELLRFAFDDFHSTDHWHASNDGGGGVAVLTSHNEIVDRLNNILLERLLLRGERRTYFSSDTIYHDDNGSGGGFSRHVGVEAIHAENPSGMPPHALNLREGATIILLENINLPAGICNGTRMVIEQMRDDLILARVITGISAGQVMFVGRLIAKSEPGAVLVQFERRQFPIRLAFAMTINKAQGQTFARVGIHLGRPVFNHGQLYVAFSRVSSFAAVRVFTGRSPDEDGNYRVRNVVNMDVIRRSHPELQQQQQQV